MKDELKHWGILGMKWGVRRYQNDDGSLTPAGRERYGVGVSPNLRGVNDAGSLSDDELYKMTKRYQKQADYYQARNNYIYQENAYKRNTEPVKKEHTFLKNVFVRPLENFLSRNAEFGMNYMIYSLIGSSNPELAAQYLSSVSGMKINAKDSVEDQIAAINKRSRLIEAENNLYKNTEINKSYKDGSYQEKERLKKETDELKKQNNYLRAQQDNNKLEEKRRRERNDARMSFNSLSTPAKKYVSDMFDIDDDQKRKDYDYDPYRINPTDPTITFKETLDLFKNIK